MENTPPEAWMRVRINFTNGVNTRVYIIKTIIYVFHQLKIGKEASNPYSLCDNLPKICDTNTRVPPITKSIMPTILSTWKIRYTVESGEIDLTWDALNPATNLLIIAKVKLRFLPNPNLKKRRVLWHHRDETALGYCTGNIYRREWRDKRCVPCPSKPNGPTNSVREREMKMLQASRPRVNKPYPTTMRMLIIQKHNESLYIV